MSKYINADDVYDGMRKHRFEAKYITIGEFIDHLPSADVVEVVRCKDCKYYTDYMAYTKNFKSHYCSGGFVDSNMALHPDDFCSYGERKGKKQNERK